MLGITLARGYRQCCRLSEMHKIMNCLGVECHCGLFLLYSVVLQFIFYFLHWLPKSQGYTRLHQTQQSTTAAPENINADPPPPFNWRLIYIRIRLHCVNARVCVCVHTATDTLKNKGRARGERERGGEREAHYNQAIMLAELEASLFSLVAAWVWRRFFKWLQPNPWMWLTILC